MWSGGDCVVRLGTLCETEVLEKRAYLNGDALYPSRSGKDESSAPTSVFAIGLPCQLRQGQTIADPACKRIDCATILRLVANDNAVGVFRFQGVAPKPGQPPFAQMICQQH